MRRLVGAIAVLVAAVTACVDDPREIGPGDIVRLLISNDSFDLRLADTLRLRGFALDASGAVVSGRQLTWGTDRTDIIEINPDSGWAIGLMAGMATVTARFGDLTAETRVRVAPGPRLVLDGDSVAFEGQAGGENPAVDTIEITNAGGFALSGLTVDSIVYDDTTVTGWLMAGIDSNSAPTQLRLTPMTTGMTVPGTYAASLRVLAADDVHDAPQSVRVSLRITPGDPASIAVNQGDSQTAVVNQPISQRPGVVVRDAFGNAVAGEVVEFAPADGDGSVTDGMIMTDANGLAVVGGWRLGLGAGIQRLQARVLSDTTLPPAEFVATGTSAAAALVRVESGNTQSAVVGTELAAPLVVRVEDAFRNPVAGQIVNFVVTAGGGSVFAGANITNENGVAQERWTLGTGAGAAQAVQARAVNNEDGTPLVFGTFTATATADLPSTLALVTGDAQSDTVGALLSLVPTVRVADQHGNPVAGVNVGFAVTAGGGSVDDVLVATGADGRAGTPWTLGTSPGAQSLSATVAGLSGSPVTFGATASAGTAAQIVAVQGDGQAAPAGSTLATPPTVRVSDGFGNPISGVAVTFTITGGDGELTGGNATTSGVGLASVGSWTLGDATGNNAMRADAGNGLIVDFTATGVAADAATITLFAGDTQSAPVGTAVATAPAVRVTDQFGNPVADVAVTFVATGGGGSVIDGSALTDANGEARPTSWTLGTTSGVNTVQAISSGLAGSPIVFTATATAGAATSITLFAGDGQTRAAGSAVTTPPSVRVFDTFGNAVEGHDVTFAVTGGGGNVTGGIATSDATGTATVGSWVLGQTAGPNALTATSTGLTGSPVAFTATGVAGPAATVAVTAGQGQSATVGTAVATAPSVTVTDQFDNPVEGVTVTFAVTQGGGGVGGSTPATDAAGVATLATWTLGTTVGANQLQASTPGATIALINASGVHDVAAAIVVTQQPSPSAASGAPLAVQPSVELVDQYGNAVDSSGVTITASLIGASSLDGTVASFTDLAGTATWDDLAVTGTAGSSYRIRFAGTALVPDTSDAIVLATGSAVAIAVSAGNNQTDTVGQALPVAPAVLVTDNGDNPVAGVEVTFAVTGGGGGVTGGTAITNASGRATVGSWTLGTAPGPNTLTATATGLAGSPVLFTATAVTDAPDDVVITAGDGQTAVVGTTVAIAPSVTVTDQFDNPIEGAEVVFAVSLGGGSALGTTVSTNASGVATVGSWTLGTGVGDHELTATVSGVAPVTFTATADHGVAAALLVTTQPAPGAVSGEALTQQPVVALVDQYGNAVDSAGLTVTAELVGTGTLNGTVAEVTNAAGVATWTTVAITGAPGSYRLRFTHEGLVPDTTNAIALAAGPPDTLFIVMGDAQSATVGTMVAVNPVVRVTDGTDNPAAGVEVTFAVTQGSGTLQNLVVLTDGSGNASPGTWTLGNSVGPNAITATSPGLKGSPVTFTATGTVGAAANIAVAAGNNQTAVVATAVAVAPQVLVTDALGNPVSGVAVTWAVTDGGGLSTGNNTVTDGDGLATVGSWTLGQTVGANALTATASGLAGSPVAFSATGAHDVAVRLVVAQEPATAAQSGVTLGPQPTVQVLDQYGNDAETAGIEITAALIEAGTLVGTAVQQTAVSGLATWTNLAISGTVGTYRLRFTATGMTPDTSATITLSAGLPASIVANQGQGQTDTVGQTVPVNPRVLVRDAASNPVAGVEVTFTVTSGGGSRTGGTTTTNASGFASVGNWTLGTTPIANTLEATALVPGSPVVFTATAVVDAPAIVYATQGEGQSAVAGTAVAIAPAVRVDDQYGNPVPGRNVTFAVTLGAGSVNPVTAVVTNASGIAMVTSWTLDATPGNPNELTATAAGAGITDNPIVFTATGLTGGDGALEITTEPSTTATAGIAFAQQPVIQLLDPALDPDATAGVNVTVSLASGAGGTLQGTLTQLSNASGVVTFTGLRIDGVVGDYTLSFTAMDRSGAVSTTVTVSAGAAATLTLSAGNGQSATAGTAVAVAPAALVTDAFANPVSGVNVTFAVTGGGGAVDPITAIATNASGMATVTSWTLGTDADVANTLTATSAGLSGSPVLFSATVTADVPATVVADAGDGQSATVGTAVAVDPSVLVTDQYGNPVPDVEVVFAVTGGGGNVTGGTTTTDSDGIATVGSWVLGQTAGPNTLSATVSAGGVTGNPVAFSATGTVGAAAVIAITTEPSAAAQAGLAVAQQPVVQLRDAFGNAVSQGGTNITATLVGTGTLGGTTVQASNGSGVATFTNLSIGAVTGTYRLRFASGGLVPDTSIAITLSAGTATSIAVHGGNAQSAVAGTAVAIAPSVIVRDAFTNPVPSVNVTFAVTGGGGTVDPVTAIATNAGGVAQVTSWTLGTNTALAQTLTATSAGLSGSPVLFSATAVADIATTIVLNAGDGQSATAGTAVAVDPSVLVTDQYGNPVSGVQVTFAVTGGGGTVDPVTAVATNASGIATATSWTLGSNAALAQTLTATSSGLTGSPVLFSATAVADAAENIALDAGNGQSATVGTAVAVAPRVRVTDQFGNPVAGVNVTFAVTGGGGSVDPVTAVPTDVDGYAAATSWTLGTDTALANTLTATSSGLSGSPLLFSATPLVDVAAIIVVNAGNNQTATVGTAVAVAPSVLVTDQYDNPIGGVEVTFAVTDGGGSVDPVTAVTTNASGIATVTSWTLGTSTAGAQAMTATATGLTGSPVLFSATAAADVATTIVLEAGNGQSAVVGTAVAVAPRVLVTDQHDNPVQGVNVTFGVTAGGGSVDPVTAIATDADGFATVTSWTLGTDTAFVNTLTATSAGLTGSPVLFSATPLVDVAAIIVVNAGNGQSAVVGTAVAVAPSVLVTDQHDNPIGGVEVTFAVTGGGGAVDPVTAVTTNASGIATVTSWTLGTDTSLANTLTATSSGLLGSPVLFSATPLVDVAAIIAVHAGNNQSAQVGTAVAVAPSVRVTDQYGNRVSGVQVTFAVTGGGGAVDPVTAVTTSASGVAGVTSWTLGNDAGPNTLSATAVGLTGSPVDFSATGTAGAATTMVLNDGDGQSATVATQTAVRPSVYVTDALGNPVEGVVVTFAVTGGGGGSTGNTPSTDAFGVARVGSWTLGNIVGSNTMTATVGGLTGSPVTFTATGTPGAPSLTASFVQASPTSFTAQLGTSGTTITVTVRDAFTNVIAGREVTLAVNGSDNSITQPVGVTDGSGQITGSFGSTFAQVKTVTGTIVGVGAIVNTTNVTVNPGPATAANSEVTSNVGSITANNNGSSLATITVTARDQFNNPVSGLTVSLASSGSNNSINQPVGTTNSVGQITGSMFSTFAESKTITATLNPGSVGVTDNAVVMVNPAAASAGNSSLTRSVASITANNDGSSQALMTLTVRDQFNNARAGDAVTFTSNQSGTVQFRLSAGNTTINASGTTDAAGQLVRYFNGTLAATHTISASVVSNTVAVNPAAASVGNSSLTRSVTSITANNAGSSQALMTLTVRDVFNNPRAGDAVTFTSNQGGTVQFRLSAGNSTINASGSTDGNGQLIRYFNATLANVTHTISASVVSNTVAVVPAAASAGNSSLTRSVTSITANNTGSSQALMTLTVRDVFNNVRVGDFVSFTSNQGGTVQFRLSAGNTTISSTGNTDGSGQLVRYFNATLANVTHTISASVVSQTVTVNPAAPSSVTVTNAGFSARVGFGLSTRPTFTVRDAFSNLVPNFAVSYSTPVGSSSGTYSGPSSTNVSGQATLTSWTMVGTATDDASGRMPNQVRLTAGSAIGTATSYGIHTWNDVAPLISTGSQCQGCHDVNFTINPNTLTGSPGGQPTTGTACDSYGTSGGRRVVAFNASSSLLYLKLAQTTPPCGVRMPQGGTYLLTGPLKIIRAWINNGAQNN